MKKHFDRMIPYFEDAHVYDVLFGEKDNFDPMGSYTGRPKACDEIPVQDADDL